MESLCIRGGTRDLVELSEEGGLFRSGLVGAGKSNGVNMLEALLAMGERRTRGEREGGRDVQLCRESTDI